MRGRDLRRLTLSSRDLASPLEYVSAFNVDASVEAADARTRWKQNQVRPERCLNLL